MSDKIETIKTQLASLENHLKKYKSLYAQSGLIDDEIAKKMDEYNALIERCKSKIEVLSPSEISGIEQPDLSITGDIKTIVGG